MLLQRQLVDRSRGAAAYEQPTEMPPYRTQWPEVHVDADEFSQVRQVVVGKEGVQHAAIEVRTVARQHDGGMACEQLAHPFHLPCIAVDVRVAEAGQRAACPDQQVAHRVIVPGVQLAQVACRLLLHRFQAAALLVRQFLQLRRHLCREQPVVPVSHRSGLYRRRLYRRAAARGATPSCHAGCRPAQACPRPGSPPAGSPVFWAPRHWPRCARRSGFPRPRRRAA